MKQIFANTVIVIAATLIGLLVCEYLARFFINPADYLSVSMERHDILGRVVAPHSHGFDEWGFRNKTVPASVDIVAIGDSHTYGNTAKMDESWPSVLGYLTGKSVYNMGMGGYGPNQYQYLLKSKALHLKPQIILCGLYLGDDFENSFSITYGLDYWAFLRKGRFDQINPDIWKAEEDTRWLKGLRIWLSRNSVVYQLVIHGPVLGKIKGNAQLERASHKPDPYVTTLVVEDQNIREAFRPSGIRDRLDQKKQPVIEGIRITYALLKDMHGACRRNGSRFIVVVIPTKETVFEKYLENNPGIHLSGVIDDLIRNERVARSDLLVFLRNEGIDFVDTLPALKRAVNQELYARTDRDMHPGKNGYRIIAETVANHIQTTQ